MVNRLESTRSRSFFVTQSEFLELWLAMCQMGHMHPRPSAATIFVGLQERAMAYRAYLSIQLPQSFNTTTCSAGHTAGVTVSEGFKLYGQGTQPGYCKMVKCKSGGVFFFFHGSNEGNKMSPNPSGTTFAMSAVVSKICDECCLQHARRR